VVSLDFASKKTELLILSLGGATDVINLFNIELIDVFRTKQCWSAPKITNLFRHFKDRQSNVMAYFFGPPCVYVTFMSVAWMNII